MRAADLTWYCFRTAPRGEQYAERQLRARGYQVYLPKEERAIKIRKRSARTKKAADRRDQYREYPQMVGYILVGFPGPVNWREMLDNWNETTVWHINGEDRPVSVTHGCGHLLKSVIGFDGRPAAIDGAAIEKLRATEAANMPYLSAYSGRRSIQEGEYVRICDGAWSGWQGRVEDISQQGMASIIVTLFGRQVYRHEPLANLDAA